MVTCFIYFEAILLATYISMIITSSFIIMLLVYVIPLPLMAGLFYNCFANVKIIAMASLRGCEAGNFNVYRKSGWMNGWEELQLSQ